MFKDAQGRWKTKALFKDYSKEGMFWLHRCNQETPCLHCAYVKQMDPTGYLFAEEHLGGWDHFQKLSKILWFKAELDQWSMAVETKMKAEGIQAMRVQAKKGSSPSAKWLAEKGWDQRGAGRPSKIEKARALKVEADLGAEVEELHSRMFN
jgi:hypothetical protein